MVFLLWQLKCNLLSTMGGIRLAAPSALDDIISAVGIAQYDDFSLCAAVSIGLNGRRQTFLSRNGTAIAKARFMVACIAGMDWAWESIKLDGGAAINATIMYPHIHPGANA